ncbi:YicC/YloC family endoribonuclease [Oricola sp.]|uniref:YicC/YloC family endoribonuclease n=1 Tax=Oricola sp. TaxID=1979950 RepID=UPI0025F199D4|nr:YicC/YloC family endoribonuclease [Oricola sp.]MCI5077215.1 YicC family protein [Oricola sp.]
MTAVHSMTGFANAVRRGDGLEIACDIRSVNNKGLDVRLRLPTGLERLEQPIKKRVSEALARGSIAISMSVRPEESSAPAAVDEGRFRALAATAMRLAEECGVAPPTADGLLGLRGVILADDAEMELDPDTTARACLEVVGEALEALVAARVAEGEALRAILTGHVETIGRLTDAAEADPASQPAAISQRLKEQVSALLDASAPFDAARLHAEAAVLATKADIREEIDRLHAHVASAREMLRKGGAIGRKLDFLAQEFNRETNTICSKSASATLTAIGLDLKAVIDQFREQVQNLQ